MKVRNTTEAPIQFMVRTNAGETVTLRDRKGETYTEEAKPVLTHIYIPAKAEVELEDKIWENLMTAKTTVQEYAIEETEYEQFDEKMTYKKQVKMPTGVYKTISLMKARLDSGDLKITEKTKSSLTIQEKAAKLKEMGIVITKETHTAEQVETIYEKIFG